MCLKVHHFNQYKMDYSRNLIINFNRSFQIINPTQNIILNIDRDFTQNLTQNITQTFTQSSNLIVRVARFVLDFYYSTMGLSFLIQLFTSNHEINFESNLNQQDKIINDICNQQVNEKIEVNFKIPFTPTKDEPKLPDIITSHQNLNKKHLKKEDLIDIGRKLRFIAEQFEKKRGK